MEFDKVKFLFQLPGTLYLLLYDALLQKFHKFFFSKIIFGSHMIHISI